MYISSNIVTNVSNNLVDAQGELLIILVGGLVLALTSVFIVLNKEYF